MGWFREWNAKLTTSPKLPSPIAPRSLGGEADGQAQAASPSAVNCRRLVDEV